MLALVFFSTIDVFFVLYSYDGSIEGLFSAVSFILRNERDPSSVVLQKHGGLLFEDERFIATDQARADELVRRFSRAFPENARDVVACIHAEEEGLETSLLHYIHLVAVHGGAVSAHLAHPAVHEIRRHARRVRRELHRFKGLLRFQELEDGTFLARMEPDVNIIQPLSRYFIRRLRTQQWFIYDVRRSLVSRWDRERLEFGTLQSFRHPDVSVEEEEVQALWKTFFDHVTIPERHNERCQKSFMPMKYWKYLVEKGG